MMALYPNDRLSVSAVRFDPHDRFGKIHWHVYVSPKYGVAYLRSWKTQPTRQAVLNDFYRDHDCWVRSSRGVPGIAQEVEA